MAVVYGCPGVDQLGRGLAATFVHVRGCCAAFALMSDERQQQVGLRWVAPEQRPAEPGSYEVDTIDVEQLVAVVEQLQRAGTEHPEREPVGTIAYVRVPHDYPMDEFLALLDLGRPYGLVAGYSRQPAP